MCAVWCREGYGLLYIANLLLFFGKNHTHTRRFSNHNPHFYAFNAYFNIYLDTLKLQTSQLQCQKKLYVKHSLTSKFPRASSWILTCFVINFELLISCFLCIFVKNKTLIDKSKTLVFLIQIQHFHCRIFQFF